MITVESKETREQAGRWIEEGPRWLSVLGAVLNSYDRLQDRTETAERENERLRGLGYEIEQVRNRLDASERECERLREEVSRLLAEAERSHREREELVEGLTRVLNEALVRLRGDQGSR